MSELLVTILLNHQCFQLLRGLPSFMYTYDKAICIMGLFVSSSRTKIDVFGAISQCSSRLFLFSYVQRTSAEFSRWQDLSVNTAPAKCEAAWADLRACLTERIQGGHAKSGPALLDS